MTLNDLTVCNQSPESYKQGVSQYRGSYTQIWAHYWLARVDPATMETTLSLSGPPSCAEGSHALRIR